MLLIPLCRRQIAESEVSLVSNSELQVNQGCRVKLCFKNSKQINKKLQMYEQKKIMKKER